MTKDLGWMYHNLRGWDTRWTPVTDEVIDYINDAIIETGGIAVFAREVGIWPRHLRKIRRKKLKVISLMVLDRLLYRSSHAMKIHELPWYTVEELVEMGIWKAPWNHYVRHVA